VLVHQDSIAVSIEPCQVNRLFGNVKRTLVSNTVAGRASLPMSVVGTFATSQLHRAVSAFRGNPEEIYSG
jgi:hypothetical protein